MYDTLNSILRINTDEFNNLELNDVVLRFQDSNDSKFRNKCFAHIFKNVFPMLWNLHQNPKYEAITYDEKTEECLCCVLAAMKLWKKDKGQKISSYIYTIISTQFLTLVSRYKNGNKYKVFDNLISNPEISDYALKCIPYNSSNKLYNFLKDLKHSRILNHDEIEYCEWLLKGYRTNKQIAEQMKLQEYPKYIKKNKEYVTLPIASEKDAIKYCSFLRQSIKKKLRENNYNLF